MIAKIAVAGAGIYGADDCDPPRRTWVTNVRLFDPLGILRGRVRINQYRIHSGYHYPRSPETIRETLEARAEFTEAFAPAIVRNSRHYYAIPKEGSQYFARFVRTSDGAIRHRFANPAGRIG